MKQVLLPRGQMFYEPVLKMRFWLSHNYASRKGSDEPIIMCSLRAFTLTLP